jgi:hypothetical protein
LWSSTDDIEPVPADRSEPDASSAPVGVELELPPGTEQELKQVRAAEHHVSRFMREQMGAGEHISRLMREHTGAAEAAGLRAMGGSTLLESGRLGLGDASGLSATNTVLDRLRVGSEPLERLRIVDPALSAASVTVKELEKISNSIAAQREHERSEAVERELEMITTMRSMATALDESAAREKASQTRETKMVKLTAAIVVLTLVSVIVAVLVAFHALG